MSVGAAITAVVWLVFMVGAGWLGWRLHAAVVAGHEVQRALAESGMDGSGRPWGCGGEPR